MKLTIKQIRESKGVTVAALAAKAGMSPSYLSEIENHQKPINGNRLSDIAIALGVREFDLIDFPEMSQDIRSLLRIAATLSPEAQARLLERAQDQARLAEATPHKP